MTLASRVISPAAALPHSDSVPRRGPVSDQSARGCPREAMPQAAAASNRNRAAQRLAAVLRLTTWRG
jgi:hypothetical protein